MIVTMVCLVGLTGLGALALLITRGGFQAAAHDRFQNVALLAAESGVAAGVSFLRDEYKQDTRWSALVSPSNTKPSSPAKIPGNGVASGGKGSLFSDDLTASFDVTILNNPADPSYVAGADADGRILLRSVGHGPDGATVILEVEISAGALAASSHTVICDRYGQRGLGEDGAGRGDCLGTVDGNTQVTFKPGG